MEKITAILAISAMAIILTLATCDVVVSANDNKAMTEMVQSGADPVDARCAIRGSYNSSPVCAIRAATKSKAQ